MKILAIESSCDETAVSVVKDGWKVLANTIASQVDLHEKTGGVVPEVAAREHVLQIMPVLDECLNTARIDWPEIDAVAVTKGPGLLSSLMIGTQTAGVISYVKKKPLIEVNHIWGHLYSNWLDREEEIELPVLVLTVSGGHNELVIIREHGEFEVLGETLDDAAGEAFDKVARILGLGYPGGPAIAKIAEQGDSKRFKLPRVLLEKSSLDFSFSGLKTAVMTEVKKYIAENGLKSVADFDQEFVADMAAAFQEAVVEVLVEKLERAFAKYPEVRELHLAGGVSANRRLREAAAARLGEKVKLRWPTSIKYCTDNAAMIAAAAYFIHKKFPDKFSTAQNVVPEAALDLKIS